MKWIGVDVGGTFTDVVAYDEAAGGPPAFPKPPPRPADPTVGLLNALAKLEVALPATGRVVHGTTIGTNAILERTGAGPAVVEEMGATTVIPPGWTGTVDPWGELVLERRSL